MPCCLLQMPQPPLEGQAKKGTKVHHMQPTIEVQENSPLLQNEDSPMDEVMCSKNYLIQERFTLNMLLYLCSLPRVNIENWNIRHSS